MQLIMMHTSNWCFFSSLQLLNKCGMSTTEHIQVAGSPMEGEEEEGLEGEEEEEGLYELAMLHTITIMLIMCVCRVLIQLLGFVT